MIIPNFFSKDEAIFADGNYFKILSNECEVLEEFASFIREPIESAQKICN